MNASDRLKGEMEQPGELPFSDDYLASQFSAQHADDLRYVAKWSHWYQWGGQQWREEQTVHVFELVRLRCRAIAASCNEGGKGLVRAATIAGVEKLARGDERHKPKIDAWDTDLDILNTEEGKDHER